MTTAPPAIPHTHPHCATPPVSRPSLPLPVCGPPAPAIKAILDTGCTSHFFTEDTPVINKKLAHSPIRIANPDGSYMQSTHTAELDLPLPVAARTGHIVPALSCRPLLSAGQLYDGGCDVDLHDSTVDVTYNGNTVLSGQRPPASRLWEIDLPCPDGPSDPPPQHPETALSIRQSDASPANLVAFYHAALFSPAISTLETAFRQSILPEFAGFTLKLLQRYPPKHSIAMIKGHLDQSRQNQRSTKLRLPPIQLTGEDISADAFPSRPPGEASRTHFC